MQTDQASATEIITGKATSNSCAFVKAKQTPCLVKQPSKRCFRDALYLPSEGLDIFKTYQARPAVQNCAQGPTTTKASKWGCQLAVLPDEVHSVMCIKRLPPFRHFAQGHCRFWSKELRFSTGKQEAKDVTNRSLLLWMRTTLA